MRIDLNDKKFIYSIQIRLNDTYVLYDEYLKKYINITAFQYTEDLM